MTDRADLRILRDDGDTAVVTVSSLRSGDGDVTLVDDIVAAVEDHFEDVSDVVIERG